MNLTIQGYLTLKRSIGRRQLSLPEGHSLRDLLTSLRQDFGLLISEEAFNDAGVLREQLVVLLNGTHIRHLPDGLSTALKDGDQIAIFPPLAGGE